MISFDEAIAILRREVTPLAPRRLQLDAAAGAVTAEPLRARVDVPGFDNSAMDGFALRAADIAGAAVDAPVLLPVAGSIAAGDVAPVHRPGVTWEILTGAQVPPGCDAVVPVERVLAPGESMHGAPADDASFTAPAPANRNIRRTGEDFRRNDTVVAEGVRLEPQHLMALAATGHDDILVRATPRVSLLTTGNELGAAGIPALPGRLRDANGPYLRAALPRLGASLVDSATVPDSESALAAALGRLAGDCDVLITTGGVSAGRLDLVPAAVERLGGSILFHKVAIRPGKPVLAARMPSGALLLGLPGNPVATAVGARFFLASCLRTLQGLAPEVPTVALLEQDVRRRGRLRFVAKARMTVSADGRQVVTILPGQESFRIGPLIEANCWAIVREGDGVARAGETLEIVPLLPS